MTSFTQTTLRTGCKINLFLNICALRSDGYHDLETLFYPLPEPYDELVIQRRVEPGLGLVCPQLPCLAEEDTTLHRAWRLFQACCPLPGGFEIVLRKKVPTGAGLGGGSANAAGFLLYLNNLAGKDALSPTDLAVVAAKVGADVPFFLLNKPALATGIGDKLQPLPVNLSGFYLLLVCPPWHVSTAWAYKEWDRLASLVGLNLSEEGQASAPILSEQGALGLKNTNLLYHCPQNTLQSSLTSCALTDKETVFWPWFYNNLEQPVFSAFPGILQLKEKLLRAGAAAALMSGSGASVFGLFRSKNSAEAARLELAKLEIAGLELADLAIDGPECQTFLQQL